MNNRLPHIDFGAGVMVLWMIIYHALPSAWSFRDPNPYAIGESETLNPCMLFPYLHFFMPWFFYKSGQLFEKRARKDLLRKDYSKLLFTFVIWSAIGYVFFLLFGALQHSLTLRSTTYSIVRGLFLTGKIPINEPLWFMLTLFGVRLFANIVLPERGDEQGWWKIITVVIGGYLLAYLYFRLDYRLLPYWVANGTSGLVFFALGYAIHGYEDKWWLIVPCVTTYMVCCFAGFSMVDMMYNKLLTGNYLLWIPEAFCGIVVFNTLCKWICKYVHISPIELAGQNAMIIYVTHILIVSSCIFVVNYFEITKSYPYVFWIIVGAYIVLLPILCHIIPKIPVLIGKSK